MRNYISLARAGIIDVDGVEPRREAPQRRFGYSIPHGCMPVAIPTTLVCGPPGAGKSTYVKEHATSVDTIIDLDLCRQSVGGAPWVSSPEIDRRAFKLRADLIHSLSTKTEGRAWLIVSAPSKQERDTWLQALGPMASMVLLDVPADVCKQRIDEDPGRARARKSLHDAVDRWWIKHRLSSTW
jgi:predicted kinase